MSKSFLWCNCSSWHFFIFLIIFWLILTIFRLSRSWGCCSRYLFLFSFKMRHCRILILLFNFFSFIFHQGPISVLIFSFVIIKIENFPFWPILCINEILFFSVRWGPIWMLSSKCEIFILPLHKVPYFFWIIFLPF